MPPTLDVQWFNGICELGPRPLVVTGWLKVWLENHFSTAGYIEDQSSPALIRDLWTSLATTGIAIESVTAWRPELTEKRPAIIIKRNSWKHVRLGIDNRMMIGGSPPDEQPRYCNVWQGSHTLYCIAGDGAEVEKLAAEVFGELNKFGPRIRIILDLMRFEVMEVGEVSKMKQNARENWVVPISVAYAYRDEWVITQAADTITSIDLAAFQP